jgi:hypothetical protein
LIVKIDRQIALSESQTSHRAYPEHDHVPAGISVAECAVAHNEVPR